jgi:hypothetical protein
MAMGVGSASNPYQITRTHCSLARSPHTHSPGGPRNGNFAHASTSDGPLNLLELQALYPAQPSALVLYCSDCMLEDFHPLDFTSLTAFILSDSGLHFQQLAFCFSCPTLGLVHTCLGSSYSSYLIVHILHCPPPPLRTQLCTRSCSNKHNTTTQQIIARKSLS